MRIVEVEQGSEEWHRVRSIRPTASRFHEIITPAHGKRSAQATKYACEIVAARNNLSRAEMMPSAWMEWGTEMEPSAVLAYEKQFGVTLHKAGFVLPDRTDAWGCSPDRLINLREVSDGRWECDGGVEIKCVAPEKLLLMKHEPEKHAAYSRPQIQGEMMTCSCPFWDLYVFHPELEPLWIRWEADEDYQAKIAEHLLTFHDEIKRIEASYKPMKHELVVTPTTLPASEFS